jgi:hypothetical protein
MDKYGTIHCTDNFCRCVVLTFYYVVSHIRLVGDECLLFVLRIPKNSVSDLDQDTMS